MSDAQKYQLRSSNVATLAPFAKGSTASELLPLTYCYCRGVFRNENSNVSGLMKLQSALYKGGGSMDETDASEVSQALAEQHFRVDPMLAGILGDQEDLPIPYHHSYPTIHSKLVLREPVLNISPVFMRAIYELLLSSSDSSGIQGLFEQKIFNTAESDVKPMASVVTVNEQMDQAIRPPLPTVSERTLASQLLDQLSPQPGIVDDWVSAEMVEAFKASKSDQ